MCHPSARLALHALVGCVLLTSSPLPAQGKKKPCDGGDLRVRHAYPECRNNRWHIIEIGYYVCPGGRHIDAIELGATPTEQECGKGKDAKESTPWTLPGSWYKNLQGDSTCKDPRKIEPVVYLECVAEFWAYAKYELYECSDGSRRIARPASSLDRSTTPCTQEPPKYTFRN